MFKLVVNNTPDHAEHDWLVLDRQGVFLAGFATSNGAERWINAREAEAREARVAFRRARAARRMLARTV